VVLPVPRIVGRADALELGYDDDAIARRVRSGRWRRVLPHTYLTVDTLTWLDQQLAALTFAGPRSVLSGAAALHGEMRAVRQPSTLLVLVPYDIAPRSVNGVHIRRTVRMPEPRRALGPRRAPVARAIADLALEMRRLDDVRALVTEGVRTGLCSVDELRLELRSGPRRYSKPLREAIEDVDDGAWSAPEARAGRLLRQANAPAFEQNARIQLGSRTYFADFLWRELMAIVEIDSVEHHDLLPSARDDTDDRHAVLERYGYSVLHFTPSFVYRKPELFVDRVLTWLTARADDHARTPRKPRVGA